LEELFSAGSAEAAPELAHHFEESRDWSRATKYLRLVAEIAGRRYAPREAAAALQHAVELSRKLPDAERAGIETEILTKLASIYLVSFDMRVVETCEALAARAAHYGLIDVEVRALIDMAYPLSWISSERCIKVLERALELSATQKDPLLRASTRAGCLVRRIWAGGWSARDAAECRRAVAEIGDRRLLASQLIDYNFIQWVSSEYREAQRNAVENLAILGSRVEEHPYLSTARWQSQFILPWSLLFLGEWVKCCERLTWELRWRTKTETLTARRHYVSTRLGSIFRQWISPVLWGFAIQFSHLSRICRGNLGAGSALSCWARRIGL
jgi:hypothetical protein